ncbi:unnamed protein product [Bursaphelenchus xylophilus]|uniref:(pine wood nematode) hypothetical protein n=1 Tax=Bursaphelenchus xylophilus TaxID=6326 RepID=A0A1I7RQF8_BURXY|nr:unnamed protein product [Bursaphelenchus xylophilus]CAG9104503.1 unnamed protein product [Bursaphelenchus xylophilus]
MSCSTLFYHLIFLSILIPTITGYRVRWLVMELKSFQLQPNCLMNELCREPQLKTVLRAGAQTSLASLLKLNTTPQDGILDRIVSNPLEPVRLSDIIVSAEISGTDPAFNFVRICDNSTNEQLMVPAEDGGGDRKIYHLHLKGNCFRALIHVSVHENACPWCIFNAESIIAEDKEQQDISPTLLSVICIVSTLISLALFAACLIMCRINRRLARSVRRSESSSCSPSTQNTSSSDSGYDVPWRHYHGGVRAQRIIRGPSQNSGQNGTYHRPTTIIPQHAILDDQSLLRLSPSEYPHKPSMGVCLNTAQNRMGLNESTIHITAVPFKEHHDDSGRDSI